MASSSVSQEDFEQDFEIANRRSKVRASRARAINTVTARLLDSADCEEGAWTGPGSLPGESSMTPAPTGDQHDASPKPMARAKDKRVRANHINKSKQQRDRRKLREKRRSTGVVHIPSTESTGGSTGEDEDSMATLELKKNTNISEIGGREIRLNIDLKQAYTPSSRRNKSPSDLEADDEDNQDYDSTVNQSDSAISWTHEINISNQQRSARPETPRTEDADDLLERAQEENKRLLGLLEDKDKRINILERQLSLLSRDLQSATAEIEKIKEENSALIRTMAQLTTK